MVYVKDRAENPISSYLGQTFSRLKGINRQLNNTQDLLLQNRINKLPVVHFTLDAFDWNVAFAQSSTETISIWEGVCTMKQFHILNAGNAS